MGSEMCIRDRCVGCVWLSINPASIGLGSGSQNQRQGGQNIVEENKQSYLQGGFPYLERLADLLTVNVLRQYYTVPPDMEVFFDISGIDYETAMDRQAETERWLSILGSSLPVNPLYIAERLGIPADQVGDRYAVSASAQAHITQASAGNGINKELDGTLPLAALPEPVIYQQGVTSNGHHS